VRLPLFVGGALFIFCAACESAIAVTDKSQCDAPLVKDIDIRNTDHFAALSALSLMKKEDFDSIKAGGGLTAGFPIDGIPIKAMANYDQFQTHLHNELSKYSTTSTISDRRSVYTAHTSETQLAAYEACLKTLVGVWLTPVKVTGQGNSAAVVVTTNIPTDDPRGRGVHVEFVTSDATVRARGANRDGSVTYRMTRQSSLPLTARTALENLWSR
jgi:hypothetical protein